MLESRRAQHHHEPAANVEETKNLHPDPRDKDRLLGGEKVPSSFLLVQRIAYHFRTRLEIRKA